MIEKDQLQLRGNWKLYILISKISRNYSRMREINKLGVLICIHGHQPLKPEWLVADISLKMGNTAHISILHSVTLAVLTILNRLNNCRKQTRCLRLALLARCVEVKTSEMPCRQESTRVFSLHRFNKSNHQSFPSFHQIEKPNLSLEVVVTVACW